MRALCTFPAHICLAFRQHAAHTSVSVFISFRRSAVVYVKKPMPVNHQGGQDGPQLSHSRQQLTQSKTPLICYHALSDCAINGIIVTAVLGTADIYSETCKPLCTDLPSAVSVSCWVSLFLSQMIKINESSGKVSMGALFGLLNRPGSRTWMAG